MEDFVIREAVLSSLPAKRRKHVETLLRMIEAAVFEEEKPYIRDPEDVYRLAIDVAELEKEHFVVLFLNTKSRVILRETISTGILNGSLVHPRETFRTAISRNAHSIICVHNHPSGDPTPSQEDIQITKRLVGAGKIIGIEVLDHIIIGKTGQFVSLKEQGLI